jgi:hypothetical protein
MEKIVQKFEDFVNEGLNFERISNTECYLTRPWYFYNVEDDIVYGSDTKPIGDFPVVFENNLEGVTCLITLNLDRLSMSVYTGVNEILGYLNSVGYGGEDLNDVEGVQDFFDMDENTRYMLLSGKRLVASSFDVIEEN